MEIIELTGESALLLVRIHIAFISAKSKFPFYSLHSSVCRFWWHFRLVSDERKGCTSLEHFIAFGTHSMADSSTGDSQAHSSVKQEKPESLLFVSLSPERQEESDSSIHSSHDQARVRVQT